MEYIKRTVENRLKKLIRSFPVVFLTGPRQSGKTTLIRHLFGDFEYYNLETPATLDRARSDPIEFLSGRKIILDEAQEAPWLFSYILELVDFKKKKFIISGSQNLVLHEKVSQSLAGRAAVVELFPFDTSEVKKLLADDTDKILLRGFYPRPFLSKSFSSWEWYQAYIKTYLEKDVRNLKKIKDLIVFQDFVKLLAGQAGGILNLHSISNTLGISVTTLKEWLSVLEASYLVFRLRPYFANIKKRLTKRSKIYFWDTGVLTTLLGIKTLSELRVHPLYGQIFENFVVADVIKRTLYKEGFAKFYFLRDKIGNEIDLVKEIPEGLETIEIKASSTFSTEFLQKIFYFQKVLPIKKAKIIYKGKESFKLQGIEVKGWKDMEV